MHVHSCVNSYGDVKVSKRKMHLRTHILKYVYIKYTYMTPYNDSNRNMKTIKAYILRTTKL